MGNEMNTKYDPEDIEYLLKSKSFDELYADERKFVLQHMEDQHEYESMRKTLMLVSSPSASGDKIEPRESIKTDLLAAFDKKQQNGFVIWLNGLLAFNKPNISWYRQPAYQLAIASVVIVFGVFWFVSQPDQMVLAENSPVKDKQELSKEEDQKGEENRDEDRIVEKESVPAEDLTALEGSSEEVAEEPELPQGTLKAADNANSIETNEIAFEDSKFDLDTEEELIAEEVERDRQDEEETKTLETTAMDDMDEVADVIEDSETFDGNTAKDAVIVTDEVSVAFSDEVRLTAESAAVNAVDPSTNPQIFSGSTDSDIGLNSNDNSLISSVSAKEVENLFDELFTAL
jgi:hypothetical protein